jgi:hypothetical protein
VQGAEPPDLSQKDTKNGLSAGVRGQQPPVRAF